jgi:hypothetical protein
MKTIFRLLPVAIILLLSCINEAKPLPNRNFSVADVLLQDSELSKYQIVLHQGKSALHIERSTFESENYVAKGKDEDSLKLMQDILRYRSVAIASERYREWSVKSDWVPEPFGVTTLYADEMSFGCVEYLGHHITCTWVGRYEEYLVMTTTFTRSTPEAVEELRRVVRITDARLTDYMRKSATTK